MLLPPGTAVCIRLGAVCARSDGHLWGRVRCPLDRFLGAGGTHVDLWIQKCVQGHQAYARFGAIRLLEGELRMMGFYT